MFSARKIIKGNRFFSKEFFLSLTNDLESSGFGKIFIKLPHNIVGVDNQEISLEDFLNKERNFPSIILTAQNQTNEEEIKILFVNISSKAFFVDDIFPSGHSEPQEIYVKSNDPARVYSLLFFFKDYIENKSMKSSSVAAPIFYLVSLLIIIIQVLTLVLQGTLILKYKYHTPIGLDIVIFLFSTYYFYRFNNTPTGLYINKKPKKGLIHYINIALKGQLSDNPLANLIISIIGSLIVAIILKIIGLC